MSDRDFTLRVSGEGQVLIAATFGPRFRHTAERAYSNAVAHYRNSDDSAGVTVQLIQDDDVLYEITLTE